MVSLLAPDKQLVDLPIDVFDALLREKKVTVATPLAEDVRRVEELEVLKQASPRQLEVATERYKLLGQAAGAQGTVPARTLRQWREAFREAEAVYGHGFVGLIPRWNKSGNHLPRLSKEQNALLEKYITDHYETLKQPSMTAVYAQLVQEAQVRHIIERFVGAFKSVRSKSRPSNVKAHEQPRNRSRFTGNWSRRLHGMAIVRGRSSTWTIPNSTLNSSAPVRGALWAGHGPHS